MKTAKHILLQYFLENVVFTVQIYRALSPWVSQAVRRVRDKNTFYPADNFWEFDVRP